MPHADRTANDSRWSYLWVAEQLRQEILRGAYRAGKRLPGEPALARRFGVGRVTVAKALEILEHSNLVFRLRSSGTYVQHDVARGTVNLTIGYFVKDISLLRSTPAGIRIEAAQQYLEQRGHAIRLLTSSELYGGGGPAANIRRMVKSGQLHGLILAGGMDFSLLERLGQIVQTACIDRDIVPDNVLAVGVDFLYGFFLAAQHLLQLGHRRIALIGGSTHSTIGYRSFQALRLAAQQAGVDPRMCPAILCGYAIDRCREEIDQLLRTQPDVTGLICGDDTIAAAAIEIARGLGRSVPQGLSVVGCNDVFVDSLLRPQLTTLRIDFEDLGRQLVELFLARIYGQETQHRYYTVPELVVRGSTGPAPQ